MNTERRGVLFNDEQLGPYPMEKLKRVDKPTCEIVGEIKQRRQDESLEVKVNRGDFGEKAQRGGNDFVDKEPIFRAFFDINTRLADFHPDPVAENKSELPEDPRVLTRHIKKLCHFMGADFVGICELTSDALYSHDAQGNPIEVDYKYAIVIGVAKHRPTINASYGCEWIDDAISMQAYQRLACMNGTLVSYIRRMGWPAESSVVPKYTTLMPRLILNAGLGEPSRLGIMINPFVGAMAKYSAVLTDLPLECDKPIDFGLQKYCENCHICADNCCSNAVPHGERENFNGYNTWVLKAVNCYLFNRTNPVGKVCQRCTKVCPWAHVDTDPKLFKDWDGDVKKLHEMADKQAQFLKENDYIYPEEANGKWWFPLRYNAEEKRYCEAPEYDYAKHYRKLELQKKKKEQANK